MCGTGVTQEQIEETRLTAENMMLADMQNILNDGGNFDFHGQSGETPVVMLILFMGLREAKVVIFIALIM